MGTENKAKPFYKFCWAILLICLGLIGCQQKITTDNPFDLVIEEHKLKYPPSTGADDLQFEISEGNKAEILARHQLFHDTDALLLKYDNTLLQPFGYRIELKQRQQAGISALYNIYRENHIFISDVFIFSATSVNSSNDKFAMSIMLSDGDYMLTNETFDKNYHTASGILYYPIYVGDELLGIGGDGDQIRVFVGNTVAYSGKVEQAGAMPASYGPWGYDGHWAIEMIHSAQNNSNIETRGEIIIDKQSVNQSLGYEQSFGFAPIANKAFFFYQTSGKIGISYDQKESQLNYDEVIHYGCCSAGLLNPGYSRNMAWFFARRDKQWYYVEAYVDNK